MKRCNQWLPALGVVAVLLVASCGSTSESGSDELPSLSTETSTADADTETEPNEVDPDEAFAAFEACMAEYGIEMSISTGGDAVEVPGSEDAPGGDGTPPNPEAFEEAQAECDPILDEAFGSFEMSPEQEAEQADMMLSLQRCLADKGYEIELDGPGFQLPAEIDIDEFDTAMSECDTEAGFNSEELGS